MPKTDSGHRLIVQGGSIYKTVLIQERTWYGWKGVTDFSIFAYGIEKAFSMARQLIKELEK